MKRGQIALLAGFTALAPLAIDMYLPALAALAADLGVSIERAGQSVSIFLLGLAAGQLVAGSASDRFGRRPVILAGVALFVVATAVAALTTSFTILLVARLLQALGACATMVSVRAAVRDTFDAIESARFFSLLTLVAGLAPLIAPIIGAVIVQFGDWRQIFWVLAGFGAVLLALSARGLVESRSIETRRQAQREGPFKAFAVLAGDPRIRPYLLAVAFNNAAFFTYVANVSIVLVDGYGFTPAGFSLVFAANSLALVGAAQVNRVLLRRHAVEGLLRLSGRNALLLAAALLAFAASQWGGVWIFAPLMLLMVGGVSPVQANAMAAGMAIDPLRAGSCAALFGAVSFACGATASWLAGIFYDGTPRPMVIVAAICIAGVGVTLRRLPGPGAPSPAASA